MRLSARRLAGLTVLLLFAPVHAAGFGAYPLSDSLASLWINTKVEGVDRPVILVFFHGAAGWHKREWETRAEGTLTEGEDSVQELVSGDLVLRARVAADLENAEVQGHAFSLRESNVFLVLDADKGLTSSIVHALGLFDLSAVSGDPLSACLFPARISILIPWI